MKKVSIFLAIMIISPILTSCLSSNLLSNDQPRGSKGTEANLIAQVTQLNREIMIQETAIWASVTKSVLDAYHTAEIQATEMALSAAVIRKTEAESSLRATHTQQLISATSFTTPTASAEPTPIPEPSIQVEPGRCEKAELLAESVTAGTIIKAGAKYSQEWRIKNSGSCMWKASTLLVFIAGNQMAAVSEIMIGIKVKPGEKINLSVELTAPEKAGSYSGYWALQTATGDRFGIGDAGMTPLGVNIIVKSPPVIKLDATQNICQASWTNATGPLACPSSPADSAGSMRIESAPSLEGGYRPENLALVMIPNNGQGGLISGRFPAFRVEIGDHFQSYIACQADQKDCDITFELGYRLNSGPTQSLGSWKEMNDGQYQVVDIDLTPLAGQVIELVLTVRSNNDTSIDNAGYWLAPIVIQ